MNDWPTDPAGVCRVQQSWSCSYWMNQVNGAKGDKSRVKSGLGLIDTKLMGDCEIKSGLSLGVLSALTQNQNMFSLLPGWVLCEQTRLLILWTMMMTRGPKLKPGTTYNTPTPAPTHTHVVVVMLCRLILQRFQMFLRTVELENQDTRGALSFLIHLLKGFPCQTFLPRHFVIIK